jgi:hypothetical protein
MARDEHRDRYEVLRSTTDVHLHLICRVGDLDNLPSGVRARGPWERAVAGPISKLKPGYRLRLARYGFVLAWTQVARFSAEDDVTKT